MLLLPSLLLSVDTLNEGGGKDFLRIPPCEVGESTLLLLLFLLVALLLLLLLVVVVVVEEVRVGVVEVVLLLVAVVFLLMLFPSRLICRLRVAFRLRTRGDGPFGLLAVVDGCDGGV